MVYEIGDDLPDAGGRPADLATAGLDLRLPEACLGVLRQGRLGAVQAAVHDRPAVQLRRDRRAPGRSRHGRHERQRQARDEPRRARPRAQGAQGPGPPAHPWVGRSGPPLHVWRRPRPRHPPRDGALRSAINDDFNLSTARRRPPCSSWPRLIWRKVSADGAPFRFVSDPPFEHDVQLRVPDVRKAREVLGFEATTSLDAMLDEVIPWIRAEADDGRI